MNYSDIFCLPWKTDTDYWRCPACGSLNAELEENLDRAHNDCTACWKSEGTLCGRCGADCGQRVATSPAGDAAGQPVSLDSLEQAARDSTNQDLLEGDLMQPGDL